MRVALFVPCYVDQLRPQVGMAALRLLEVAGLDVEFPLHQTCCGQPLLSSGGRREACRLAHRFLDVFANYDRVVCPSASCVVTVTRHYRDLVGESPRLAALEASTRELCAFLAEGPGEALPAGSFPHRVGLHASCHALRGLRQGPATELVEAPRPDPARELLACLEGLSFAELERVDECCGFGGTFAVDEEAVSQRMGLDRLADHVAGGAEVLASTDVSCLLHLEGLARRRGVPVRAMHVAEILVEALDAGMKGHAARAAVFAADAERTAWHDRALWFVRVKRDRAAARLPEWEALREAAAEIKAHTLSQLDLYLERFEHNAIQAGAHVHWARDAAELRSQVGELLESRGARRVVKSKSMLTEECGLNPYLEERGVDIVDSDLGERIVQLRDEPPSHIVLPAIHLRKQEVGELFHKEMGSPAGLADPTQLTAVARGDLRERFLAAEAGITGVNFAVAETGGIVVCTNEGNADLGTVLPPLHIACVGIEKLVPRLSDLAVYLRLLARSATGQAITAYTSHFHGPRSGGELHIVIVDNGRSQLLASEEFRSALRCIRCGACLNTCPVYRRSGGHSYEAVIPGPIGSVIEPSRDAEAHASLPFACTLCGSCADVCPVKIPLPQQLLAWRGELAARGRLPRRRRLAQRLAAAVLARPRLYAASGRIGRGLLRIAPDFLLRRTAWGRSRELPEAPRASFRELWARRDDGA